METLLRSKLTLTLSGAKHIANAARIEAEANLWNVVIAIVDDGGNFIYLERMDNCQIGSIEVAQQKAISAIKFKIPTKSFGDVLSNGNLGILALDGAIPFAGGLPIVYDNQVVGAIGVSGVTSEQDNQIASAGIAAFCG
jgi:uncharacterized protein GlcG (DUF336 family)